MLDVTPTPSPAGVAHTRIAKVSDTTNDPSTRNRHWFNARKERNLRLLATEGHSRITLVMRASPPEQFPASVVQLAFELHYDNVGKPTAKLEGWQMQDIHAANKSDAGVTDYLRRTKLLRTVVDALGTEMFQRAVDAAQDEMKTGS